MQTDLMAQVSVGAWLVVPARLRRVILNPLFLPFLSRGAGCAEDEGTEGSESVDVKDILTRLVQHHPARRQCSTWSLSSASAQAPPSQDAEGDEPETAVADGGTTSPRLISAVVPSASTGGPSPMPSRASLTLEKGNVVVERPIMEEVR